MALIRFFYKINPEELNADTYAKLQCELSWIIDMKLINNLELG